MPYTIKDPPEIIKDLPAHAQEIFIAAFNAAFEQYDGDEERSHATAWAAVKQSYEQDEDGAWIEKEEDAKEDEEGKAIEYEAEASAVRIAWQKQFPPRINPVPEPVPAGDMPPDIVAVRDDGLIVRDYQDDAFFLVPYTKNDNGEISFAPRNEWRSVRPGWTDGKAMNDQVDSVTFAVDALFNQSSALGAASEKGLALAEFVYEDRVIVKRGDERFSLAYKIADDTGHVVLSEFQRLATDWQAEGDWLASEQESDAAKAGARNSAADRQSLRAIRDLAKQIINATAEIEPSDNEDQYREWQRMMDAEDLVVAVGGTQIKSLGDDKFGGYLVVFGNAQQTDLSSFRDYFTKDTDFGLDDDGTGKSIVLYHHGKDVTLGTRKLGKADLRLDDVGVWAEMQLKLRDGYDEQIRRLIAAGKMGLSSGTASHIVQREPQANGSNWIKQWWLGLDASITPVPAEPRTRVLPIKAYLEETEVAAKALPWAGEQPAGDAAAPLEPDVAIDLSTLTTEIHSQSQETDMTDEEMKTLIAAAVEATYQKLAAEPPINPGGYAKSGEGEPVKQSATKTFDAIYSARFGDEDAATKAVLTDLVGADYRQTIYDQNLAFAKYLRFGDADLDASERKMLRTQIFPAEQVKAMLMDGYDISTIKTTMVEAQGTLGGYAVPPNVQASIVSRLPGLTVVRGSGAQIVTLTTGNSIDVPTVTGGDARYTSALRGVWGAETTSPSEKNLTLGMVPVVAQIYTYKVPMSQSLVEDAANLVTLVTNQISETLAIDEDAAFLVGDGANKPLGILPDSANGNSIATVNTGNATALTGDGLVALTDGIDAQYMSNAKFAFAKATGTAIRKLKTGAGEYLFDRDLENNKRTLFGYPFMRTEALPAIGASAYPILFGDFSGYWIVEKAGLAIVRFQDSNTGINKVEYHVRRRVGGRLVETWKLAAQYVSA